MYETKQRKVFWGKAKKKIKKDIKKDPDCYGKDTFGFLSYIVDIKKVWQEPEKIRYRLYQILTDLSNISLSEIDGITKQYKMKDRKEAVKLFRSRTASYLKLDVS